MVNCYAASLRQSEKKSRFEDLNPLGNSGLFSHCPMFVAQCSSIDVDDAHDFTGWYVLEGG